MINYNNRNLYFIFFNRAGSVLFSRWVLLPAVVSTTFCALMMWHPEARRYGVVSKTIAQIYATIIGFAIVFRTTMAFGRYFEGVRHIQAMFSKWRDAYVAQAVFIETSIMKHEHDRRTGLSKVEEVENVVHDLRFSKARLLHWFSLLCAVAVESIQHGRDLECDVAGDLANARVNGMFSSTDPSSLVQEIGEVLKARSDTEEKWRVRNHIQILGQISPEELMQISRAQEAVNLVMMWILLEITGLAVSKRVLIEPPILSRVYQELSNGMLSYFRAMQIECVPFPFPFAQVVNYTLYVYFFFCPFIVMSIIEDLRGSDTLEAQMWPALTLNFFAVAGYAALNEIAIELEDPFGDDDNDYPVAVQQWAITWAIEDSYFAPIPTEPFQDSQAGAQQFTPDFRSKTYDSEGSKGSERPSLSQLMMSPKSFSGSFKSGSIKFAEDDKRPSEVSGLSREYVSVGTEQPTYESTSTVILPAPVRLVPADRGPLAGQFRRLSSSVEAFVLSVGRRGQERDAQRTAVQRQADGLAACRDRRSQRIMRPVDVCEVTT